MRDSLDPPSSSGDQLASSNPSSIPISHASIESLVDFIKQVISPQLEGSAKINPAFKQLLQTEAVENKLSKFIVDPQTKCLQFQRIAAGKLAIAWLAVIMVV